MTETHGNGGLSRRTVVKAAAWSVPVMAVGSFAPAFAQSPVVTLTGAGCKLPGNATDTFKGYAFGVLVTNPYGSPITITITSLTLNGVSLGTVGILQTSPCGLIGTGSFTVAGGVSVQLVLLTQLAGSSSNGTLALSYTVSGAGVPGGSFNTTAVVDAAPPTTGASCRSFTQAEKDCINTTAQTP
jgi:expansin (peptidoglycan-binding protein)